MKLGIMVCNKITYDCSATGCFNAFINKEKAFNKYIGKDVELRALFHCNGCGSDLKNDLSYKVKQLKNNNIEIIHMAKCIEVECDRYSEIEYFLNENGFIVEHGTH